MIKYSVNITDSLAHKGFPVEMQASEIKKLMTFLEGETEGIANDELFEYLLMVISDLEWEESAEKLLQYYLSDKLNEGQIKNLVHDLAEDKMWEEYSDITTHADLYKVNTLIYKAFNGKVARGDAFQITAEITTRDTELLDKLTSKDPYILITCLMATCDEHAILKRLYSEESLEMLKKDASSILWNIELLESKDQLVKLKIISSEYWLTDFEDGEFESSIDSDILHEEEPED